MSTLDGSGLFAGITSGLTSTYSILANASPNGVTTSSITDAMSNQNYNSKINPAFSSYIMSNFTSLDKNSNGTLSAAEMNNLSNLISTKGLTSTQLNQLGTASGMSTEALEQVLSHFNDIDANHDGKVTSAEISGFKLKCSEEKKKTEFANKAATNMSVFYGDSDSNVDSTSLLDYKYMNDTSSKKQA